MARAGTRGGWRSPCCRCCSSPRCTGGWPTTSWASADVANVANSPAWRTQNLVYALPRLPLSLIQALGSSANALGLGLLPVLLAGARRSSWRATLVCVAGSRA